MNNITNLIKTLKTVNKSIDSYTLFEIVNNNEKILKTLCDAVMQTYENIEHIKEFLK